MPPTPPPFLHLCEHDVVWLFPVEAVLPGPGQPWSHLQNAAHSGGAQGALAGGCRAGWLQQHAPSALCARRACLDATAARRADQLHTGALQDELAAQSPRCGVFRLRLALELDERGAIAVNRDMLTRTTLHRWPLPSEREFLIQTQSHCWALDGSTLALAWGRAGVPQPCVWQHGVCGAAQSGALHPHGSS